MTEKYNENNPRFRDEFGAVNDLLTGESYLCGNSAGIGERDAIDTAIELCNLLNSLYNENEQLKLKQDKNNFEFKYHENYHEWDKDKLLIKENQSRIELKDGILTIRVYLPDINQIYNFKYRVVGRYDRIIEEG